MTSMRTSSKHAPWVRRLLVSLSFSFVAAGGVEALMGIPSVAEASILVSLDLPTLVQQADHIAVVDVGEVKSAWDERHERIYSTIQLKVVEKLKAPAAGSPAAASTAAPDQLTVVQAGGTVGDIRMTVTGMGIFNPGERSLVFLRGPADHAQVVGMTQGKRPMRYEAAAHRWVVKPPDLRQATLVRAPVIKNNQSGPSSPVVGSAARPLSFPASGVASVPVAITPAPALKAAPANSERPLDDLRTEIRQLLGASRP